MKQPDHKLLERELRQALRPLMREQRALAAPTELEDRIMRAWDAEHQASARSLGRLGFGLMATTATGLLAAVFGYWWQSGANAPSSAPAAQPAVAAGWPSDEAWALLGADPDSLHVVRIRVETTALAQHGYSVTDPDGDGLIDVEMVVGTDGIAQTMRLSSATASAE